MSSGEALCIICKHMHHQEVKCSICGHKGKGKIFREMKSTGPTDHSLHFDCFEYQPTQSQFKAKWSYVQILRSRSFPEIFSSKGSASHDEMDSICRHTLGFVGDAPVSYARWRILQNENSISAKIDCLCVLETHRMRGFGRKTLALLINDIKNHVENVGTNIQDIVIFFNSTQFSQASFAFLVKCDFRPHGDTFMIENQQYQKLVWCGKIG